MNIERINQAISDRLNDLLTSGKSLNLDLELDEDGEVVIVGGYAEHYYHQKDDEFYYDFVCTEYKVVTMTSNYEVVITEMPTSILSDNKF